MLGASFISLIRDTFVSTTEPFAISSSGLDIAMDWGRWLQGTSLACTIKGSVVDMSGNVYIIGNINGPMANVTGMQKGSLSGNNFSPSNGTGFRGFIAKFSSSGWLSYGRFIEGDGNTYLQSIAIDSSNNVYVGGHSISTYLNKFVAKKYTSSNNGAFVAKIDD